MAFRDHIRTEQPETTILTPDQATARSQGSV